MDRTTLLDAALAMEGAFPVLCALLLAVDATLTHLRRSPGLKPSGATSAA